MAKVVVEEVFIVVPIRCSGRDKGCYDDQGERNYNQPKAEAPARQRLPALRVTLFPDQGWFYWRKSCVHGLERPPLLTGTISRTFSCV
jgi:hypothetical protein